MQKCKNCDKEFKPKGIKIYCSVICNRRVNARKYYHKVKNDPEYRKKQRQNLRDWQERNRDLVNARQRILRARKKGQE